MSKECRDWNNVDLAQYFTEHYAGKITTRSQLAKEDRGLYKKLLELGKLDEVLPDKQRRDFSQTDPVRYFKEHYTGKITSRRQLQNEDSGLYNKLNKLGNLNEVLPDLRHRNFSQTDPVQYFKEHYTGKITSRKQLDKEDRVLYQKLRKTGKLNQVLPDLQLRDYSQMDPVQYFKEHYTGKITSRSQLENEDVGLYSKLRRLGKLDEVLSSQHRDFSQMDPVQYFKERYTGKITSRGQLHKADPGLYSKLWRLGKLEEIFPKKSSLDDILRRYTDDDEAAGAAVKA